MTTIYETLKADHDKHRDLLKKLAETSGDSETRRKLWETFFYDVGGHAAAEEETFYGPMIKTENGQPKARHSVAEHHELDELMQKLNETDMSSPGWMAHFKTLRHDYEHHIDEEEDEIFPAAKKAIGKDENGKMAGAFLMRKKKERELVDEKAEAALEE
jgi:hemerythrin-like domain-containing protein